MNDYMRSCTEETSQGGLRTILHCVRSQESGKVTWVSSLSNDPNVLYGGDDHDIGDTLVVAVEDIRKAQKDDPTIGKVYSLVKNKQRPHASQHRLQTPDVKLLLHEWTKLFIDGDGPLRRKTDSATQIILPRKYHVIVLRELHDNVAHL